MNDKTIFLDDEQRAKQATADKTQIIEDDKTTLLNTQDSEQAPLPEDETRQQLASIHAAQNRKYSLIKTIATGGLVIGAGATLSSFMPSGTPEDADVVPVYEIPQQATSVTDEMSYQEAFDTARAELGPGHYFTWHGQNYSTYTQEEWQRLEPEDQAAYEQYLQEHTPEPMPDDPVTPDVPVVVYDEAPSAHGVNDQMSFSQAFATARAEVGPGGVFEWRGQIYGTYYKNEWDSMDEAQRQQFASSHAHVKAEGTIEPPQETLLGEEVTELNGQPIRVAYIRLADGEEVVRIDADMDGNYDYTYDPEHNSLVEHGSHRIIGLDEFGKTTEDTSPSIIAVEETEIHGMPAQIYTLSDGSYYVGVDTDGNGSYDAILTLDSEGNVVSVDEDVLGDKGINGAAPSYTDVSPDIVIGEEDIIVEPEFAESAEDTVYISENDIYNDTSLQEQASYDGIDHDTTSYDAEDGLSTEGLLAYDSLNQEFGDDVQLGDMSEWS